MVPRETHGRPNWFGACETPDAGLAAVRFTVSGKIGAAILISEPTGSADTARRSGSSDSRPGWPADTLPRATAESGVNDAAAAGEGRRSLASPTLPGEPVADRRTGQSPAGLRPKRLIDIRPIGRLQLGCP